VQRLLPISPGTQGDGADMVWLAEGLSRAGCRQLLLRELHLAERSVVRLACALSIRLPQLVLHDRMAGARAIATATGWGLHLPSGSDVAAVRVAFPHRLGVSCHSAAEVLAAQAGGADYALLSPIWRPTSKPADRRRCLGTTGLRRATRRVQLRVFALGGVDGDRVERARRAGAYGVAVLGGLFGGDPVVEEVEARARALLQDPSTQLELPGGRLAR